MASTLESFRQLFFRGILLSLLTPGLAHAQADLKAEPAENLESEATLTIAAKKKKRKKNKRSGESREKKPSANSLKRSNLKALVGVFLQDGSQITFGGSFTMPMGNFYLDAGGDYTSWKTELIAVSLMRGAGGGGYALGLSQSLLLRIGGRAGMAMITAEFPDLDPNTFEVNGTATSTDSAFYAELRAGLELDLGGSLLASGELQLPVLGGGDGINVSAMSVYGGLGFKF